MLLLDTKCKKIYNVRLIGRSTKSYDPFSTLLENRFSSKSIPRRSPFPSPPVFPAKTHLRACVLLFIGLFIIPKYSYIYCFTN